MGFQVPQLGNIMGRRMMSIGVIERPTITTGPKYFDGDIEDVQEFPEPKVKEVVKMKGMDVGTQVNGGGKRLSKARREKARRIPLKDFIAASESASETDESGIPPPPTPEPEVRAEAWKRRMKRTVDTRAAL